MQKTAIVNSSQNSNKRSCSLCKMGLNYIDYKDVDLLKRYISYNGKILPSYISNVCSRHQRIVTNAIKRARLMALLPYIKAE